MEKINFKIFLIVSLLLYLIGCHFNSKNYSFARITVPEVYLEPVQEPLDGSERNIPSCCRGGWCWSFTPLFRYDITAFVFGTSHKFVSEFKDTLTDIGLLWGNNASKGYYRNVKLRVMMDHYEVSWKYGDNFDLYSAANTHIATCDSNAFRKIRSVKTGDQIKVKGWLVNAKISKNPNETDPSKILTWDSSVTRNDTRGGSCELMYVANADDINVIANGPRYWLYMKKIGFYSFCIILILWFYSFNRKIKKEIKEVNG
jgi:hypothetical protein